MVFQWFCADDDLEESEESSGFESTVTNVCFVGFVETCIQAFFLVALSLTLIGFGCCTSLRQHKTIYILTFPGHDLRWILTVGLFVVFLGAVGEGIMTDLTRNVMTQPHLYLPQSLALTNCIVTIVYYHHSECWNQPRLSWMLLIYWILAICGQSLRLANLLYNDANTSILRFDIVLCCMSMYGLFLMIEMNVLRTKVLKWCYAEPAFPSDLRRKDMYYSYRYTYLFRRITFSWINWLFRLGYKRPLEMTDLGCLPEEHTAQLQYNILKKAYEAESKRAHKNGTTPSLVLAFARAYGGCVLLSIILKIVSETFGIISPIAIGGVVAYASRVYNGDPMPKYDTDYVTFDEFFSNGFVLVTVMFVTSLLRFMTNQIAVYLNFINGIHVRAALQSFVYEKSLRLSGVILSNGDMTSGSIINHMSTDALAILWWWQNLVLLGSIPYILILVLVLLYMELGYAALLGASLFIITIPMQLMVATKMSQLQKRVMTFADIRLKKSNELLQGMKLLKL